MSRAAFIIAPLLSVTLAACGGGLSQNELQNDFRERDQNAKTFVMEKHGVTPFTDITEIPTSGSANYTGHVKIFLAHGVHATDMRGKATVQADFATDRISGQATDFISQPLRLPTSTEAFQEYDQYSGILNLENGAILRNGDDHMTANLTGTLSGDTKTITVDSPLIGRFFGQDASLVALKSDFENNPTVGSVKLNGEELVNSAKDDHFAEINIFGAN